MNVLLAFVITMAVLLVSLITFKVSPGVSLFACAVLMALLRINCIVVKDLSRFGRDYIDSGRYLQRVFPLI